jgi:hypothetical protein
MEELISLSRKESDRLSVIARVSITFQFMKPNVRWLSLDL